jgi:hypothetical protein
LKFRNMNPFRRQFLHDHILKPWDQAWGFKNFSFEGDIDSDTLEHLISYIGTGPQPEDMIRYFQFYQRRAEDYQKRKLYRHAGWYWNHLHDYWECHFEGDRDINNNTNKPPLLKYRLRKALKSTYPMILRTMLERVKVCLHLQNYPEAENYVRQSLLHIDHPLVSLSRMDEREFYLVTAGLFLCRAVVYIACGDESRALKDLDCAVENITNSNTRYHLDLIDIKFKLFWAIDTYFTNWGHRDRRDDQKEGLNSKNHIDDKVSREGWRTFWEWVDITELLRTEDEWEGIP